MLYWSNWDFSHTGNLGHFNFTLEESQLWQSCVFPSLNWSPTLVEFLQEFSQGRRLVFLLLRVVHRAHTCDSQDIGCSVSSTGPDTDHHPDTMRTPATHRTLGVPSHPLDLTLTITLTLCAHLRLTGHWVVRLIHWTWHWPSPWHYDQRGEGYC